MITKANLKTVLDVLGFRKQNESKYIKHYGSLDRLITVDFAKEIIAWPDGLISKDDTTSNFSSPENFVVLECVDRLLSKGYRPEHIVLEEKWQLGHDQKGGKADICVYDGNRSLLLIIECKTAGAEFRKFKKQLFLDGGQLFSYWQQDRRAKWLCLYASDLGEDLDEKGVKSPCIKYQDSIVVINCSDDRNLEKTAAKDESVRLYAQARTTDELFQVWEETYNKQTYPDVIFGKDTAAYQIGVRPIRKKNLRRFDAEDGIVNRFLEILRHNNVSDRENAFNKLVSLFVCKLVDEVSKDDDDEVDFQYRAIVDSYEDLQDRLQRLYRDGMKEFMGEKIFYVESDYADKLFAQYHGANRRKAIDELRGTIRCLKFYSNNEFAFKDVHNEELFLQNGKILVEMVQLFEPYRIVYPSRDQLLGDLFEQLLAKGFKQNEGQFFTAMPITRFIWDSLPLDRAVRRGAKLVHPRIIDYACGAGHFLTEAVEAVNNHYAAAGGKTSNDNSWVEKSVYGVEKDYRLARVSKVSLHMNGAGGGQIIFGDGLENYPERGIENGRFDILTANPPYSVEAFKAHLKLKNNELGLLERITVQGSEIEALFVERIGQLLKPCGIAAVILPSTILSTGEGPYVGAREELFYNFKIRAIVSFGKNAFQATSTETVVLFLEKFDEPPRRLYQVDDSVKAILSGTPPDEWEDRSIFDAYIAHIGVSEVDYLTFVSRKKPWTHWKVHDYFGAYCKTFDALAEFKSKRSKKAFLQLAERDQDELVSRWFYDWLLECVGCIEYDKLTIFGLIYQQKTLVVRSPDDKDEERKFLGYSWSSRRGQEGIKIENPGGLLYNAADRHACGTIAAGIRGSFHDEQPVIDVGAEYAKYVSLKDLIDFSRPRFDKSISLSPLRNVKLSRGMFHLGSVANYVTERISFTELKSADYITTDNMLPNRCGVVPYVGNAVSGSVVRYRKGDILISNIRPYLKKIWFANRDGGCSPDVLVIRSKDAKKTLPEYLYACLSEDAFFDYVMEGKSGVKMPRGDKDQIMRYPVKEISRENQQKIIAECKKIDVVCTKQKKKIEDARKRIDAIYGEGMLTKGDVYKLDDTTLFELSIGKRVVGAQLIPQGGIPVISANVFEPMGMIGDELLPDYERDSVIWGIDGDWMVNVIKKGIAFYPTDHCGVMRIKTNDMLSKVVAYALKDEGVKLGFKRSNRASIERIKAIEIAIPPLPIQKKIVAEVEKCEKEIAVANAVLATASEKKSAILNKYLK